VGPVTVADALKGVSRLGLDTSPFIYFVEANRSYVAVCKEVFRHVSAGGVTACTSVLTLTETLVHPVRLSNSVLQGEYEALLLETAGIECVRVDEGIAKLAAELRARYGLRTPDALQIATAIDSECDAFLTNDKGLRRVTEIAVLVLDDLTV
jgi:predicted nucleic acid-binding protein